MAEAQYRETRYRDRTDGIVDKLRRLERAWREGQLEIAMSLSESVKDTLALERQLRAPEARGPVRHVVSPSSSFGRVADLPRPWAEWAGGWQLCKVLELTEPCGLARSRETVDAVVAFRADQVTDLQRELRVARLDPAQQALHEVPSQVVDEAVVDDGHAQRRCRVLFQADVPAGGSAHYVIFYGNADAGLPAYTTDLSVSGGGFGLDVANNHFTAQLSRQNGQLERLLYRRGFGDVPYGAPLELSVGGEGHGEPPGIDWGHDYLASGRYQKFRVTHWERCPSFEVIRGPLFVQVRRWGYPRSPLHPLFTPSRLHMDLSYTFFAGLPYFLKEVRMDATAAFETMVIRDDEWLFYGMPFDGTVWMDRHGVLHEGPVAEDQRDDLWGVGFFHSRSRDAFIALWLEHRAEGMDEPAHAGDPVLDYFGRGQIWCRAPVREQTLLPEDAALIQKNAYVATHYRQRDGRQVVQDLRRRLLEPLVVREATLDVYSQATCTGRLARPGEREGVSVDDDASLALKRAVWEALREVRDDQLGAIDGNMVDLGYVYDVRVRGDVVHVVLTMPHRGRPRFEFFGNPIRDRVLQVPGVGQCVVEFTWEPGWTAARLNEAGRQQLGL